MTSEVKARSRDRDETERRIVDAAMLVLAEGGHQEFGVNAIARQAGCDKQLIYRYFGGLEGIADAIGVRLADKLEHDLTPLSAAPPAENYSSLTERLALGLLDLLRGDRVMQRIIAWELSGPSPLVKRMVEARSKKLTAWMRAVRGELKAPSHLDAPAINAILIASTQHIVLSAAATGSFAGMPLSSEDDWDRVRVNLRGLVHCVYSTELGCCE